MAAARAVVGRAVGQQLRPVVDASPPSVAVDRDRGQSWSLVVSLAGTDARVSAHARLSASTTSPGVGTMPPVRPWKKTGVRPSTASRTSSTIWPADSSTTRIARTSGATPARRCGGNGHRRDRPEEARAQGPCSRARSIAVRATRARRCRRRRSRSRRPRAARPPSGPRARRSCANLACSVAVVGLEVLRPEVERADDPRRPVRRRPISSQPPGRPGGHPVCRARPAPSPGP